jgi:hypothetical protein
MNRLRAYVENDISCIARAHETWREDAIRVMYLLFSTQVKNLVPSWMSSFSNYKNTRPLEEYSEKEYSEEKKSFLFYY